MSAETRRVCVVLADRANYGRLKPVMAEIDRRERLELMVLCAGTMVLERFGRPMDQVQADGFQIAGAIYTELEGSTPTSMAKSVGLGVIEFASEFNRLRPDVVLIIGDRYEALAAVLAAAYTNLVIVHLQGGEVSGSIDESARHAITKFAHYHLPATKRARDYVVRMGEDPQTILGVGCPSSDIALKLSRELDPEVINGRGAGAVIDVEQPFLLVLFHPTTTEYGSESDQADQLLEALACSAKPTVLLWPNIDAGSDHISKALRRFRTQRPVSWLRTLTNLEPEDYNRVLARAAAAVGNSSSFVRDAGFYGTPVVLVGNRQNHREADRHVVRVKPTAEAIYKALQAQLAHGRYTPSTLYGDGNVSSRLADALERVKPYIQKHLHYAVSDSASEH